MTRVLGPTVGALSSELGKALKNVAKGLEVGQLSG